MLQLEELGFRSSSPNIKKIAFIAWKSLIDNFALNPGEPQSPPSTELTSSDTDCPVHSWTKR